MGPEQLSTLEELPSYLLAENVNADVYFREPGWHGVTAPGNNRDVTGTSTASGALFDLL